MIPAPFDYHAPGSLDEAIALLGRYGGRQGALRRPEPASAAQAPPRAAAHLVDISRMPGLEYIKEEGGVLKIGGAHARGGARASELDPRRSTRSSLDTAAVDRRSAGAEPGDGRRQPGARRPGERSPGDHARLGAGVVAAGPKGERTIPIDEFFQGLFRRRSRRTRS